MYWEKLKNIYYCCTLHFKLLQREIQAALPRRLELDVAAAGEQGASIPLPSLHRQAVDP